MSNYKQLLKRVLALPSIQRIHLGLDNTRTALKYFDIAYEKLKYIHVAGTNGKGSVSNKLARTLSLNGYKTGLFTSPHISSYLERIQVNHNHIDKDSFVQSLNKILDGYDRGKIQITFFEAMTIAMFDFFTKEGVDIGIIEVGLGGNLDATNVITPLVSVVTSIGFDHMNLLGNTLEEIASKKAGIIKERVPVVVGLDCNPRSVFYNKARSLSSEVFDVSIDDVDYVKCRFPGRQDIQFDNENKACAYKALQALSKYSLFTIKEDSLGEGLNAKPPCRLEEVTGVLGDRIKVPPARHIKKIYLDVAHNVHAIPKLMDYINKNYSEFKKTFVIALSESKDKEAMVGEILKGGDEIHFALVDHYRLSSIPIYSSLVKELRTRDPLNGHKLRKTRIEGIKSLLEGLITAGSESSEDEVIVICGSLYMMKDARQVLGYEEEFDATIRET